MSDSKDVLGAGVDINHVIDVFYNKMVKDDRVRDFFTIVDLTAVKRKQVNFFKILLSDVTDDIHNYMRNTHSDLVENFGLNDAHFDALSSILNETLIEQKVAGDIRSTVLKKLEMLRPFVLNR